MAAKRVKTAKHVMMVLNFIYWVCVPYIYYFYYCIRERKVEALSSRLPLFALL